MHRTQELSLQSQLQTATWRLSSYLSEMEISHPQSLLVWTKNASGICTRILGNMFWNHGRTRCVPFLKSKGLTQLTRKSLNVHWLEWTPIFLSSSRRRPCNLLDTLTVLISRLVEGGVVGELVEKVVVEENQRLSVLRIIMPCNLLETLTVLMSRLGEVEVVEEVVEEVVVEAKTETVSVEDFHSVQAAGYIDCVDIEAGRGRGRGKWRGRGRPQ